MTAPGIAYSRWCCALAGAYSLLYLAMAVAWLRTSTPERGADSVALRIVTETLLLADQIEDGEHER
jgi:hypothetical protein